MVRDRDRVRDSVRSGIGLGLGVGLGLGARLIIEFASVPDSPEWTDNSSYHAKQQFHLQIADHRSARTPICPAY